MSHPRLLTLLAPAVAAALLLFASGAQAAPHGGGGHATAVHAGGGAVHVGAVHTGGVVHAGGATVYRAGGVYHAGGVYRAGGYYGGYGYRGGYGYAPYSLGVGLSFGGYGYAPYGYGYAAPPSILYSSDYYAPAYVAPTAPAYPALPAQPDYGPAAGPPRPRIDPPAGDLSAHVRVQVPAEADVWFGEGKTRQTGPQRDFVSPTLTPGKDYIYEVRARWIEGGKEVVQTRQIDVTAGTWATVDFTKPAAEVVEPPKAKP